MNNIKLPECSGHKSWTNCGYEHDCYAVHGQYCEDCLCNYKSLGGLWHPETGKKVNPVIAFLLYGFKNTEKIMFNLRKEKNSNSIGYCNYKGKKPFWSVCDEI